MQPKPINEPFCLHVVTDTPDFGRDGAFAFTQSPNLEGEHFVESGGEAHLRPALRSRAPPDELVFVPLEPPELLLGAPELMELWEVVSWLLTQR